MSFIIRIGIRRNSAFLPLQKPDHLFNLTRRKFLRQTGHALVTLAFAMSNDGAHAIDAELLHRAANWRAEHAALAFVAVATAALRLLVNIAEVNQFPGLRHARRRAALTAKKEKR